MREKLIGSENTWGKLFKFILIWLLSSGFFYLLIVFPIYPEALSKSIEEIDKTHGGYFLFSLLSQTANLLGALFTLWILSGSTILNFIKGFYEFKFSQFCKGSFISVAILVICFLILVSIGLLSLEFQSINNISLSILLFLIIAVSEEIIFRGYLLERLQEKMSPRLAIICSSFIFSLAHLSNPNFGLMGFLNIFLCGVFFAALYLKTKNLSMPIGAHFTWNLVQNILGFSVSGQKFEEIFKIKYNSIDSLLTGGEFGLEGSILLTPIVLVFIYFVLRPQSFFKLLDKPA
jgi:uncharacterized protein